MLREDTPGDKQLVAYVEPEIGHAGYQADLQAEHVAEWRTLYNDLYLDHLQISDETFNTVGWNSSYTGQAISQERMHQWAEETIQRIRKLRPRRVLEIGCGTGMLLYRLAHECSEYWATDLSPAVVAYVKDQLQLPEHENVRLQVRAADDFEDLPREHFDVVIVNSVVQYFPGADYLLSVLEGASGLIAPGGTMWVGDVRSLPLLEAFHVSVQVFQASHDLTKRELRQRVTTHIGQEQELVVDPALFYALTHRLSQVSSAIVQIKRGSGDDELTRYRYDAFVRINEPKRDTPAAAVFDWASDIDDLYELAPRLDKAGCERLVVRGIPNKRVSQDLAIVDWLRSDGDDETLANLSTVIGRTELDNGIDPEIIWQFAEERGYRAIVSPSLTAPSAKLDVVFDRIADGNSTAAAVPTVPFDIQQLPRGSLALQLYKQSAACTHRSAGRTSLARLSKFEAAGLHAPVHLCCHGQISADNQRKDRPRLIAAARF